MSHGIVGFMDDMGHPPFMRLASQFIAAGILVLNGIRSSSSPTTSAVRVTCSYEALAILVTCRIVGFTNLNIDV